MVVENDDRRSQFLDRWIKHLPGVNQVSVYAANADDFGVLALVSRIKVESMNVFVMGGYKLLGFFNRRLSVLDLHKFDLFSFNKALRLLDLSAGPGLSSLAAGGSSGDLAPVKVWAGNGV